MWWEHLLFSVPWMLVLIFFMRFMLSQRQADNDERQRLISNVLALATGSVSPDHRAKEEFIPFDDPRMKDILDHVRTSTTADVEGES
jgi:hypothetical protein